MFKHNLLLLYRSIKRNKSSFFINLIGLSTGLASAILIFLWVNDELSVDKFHEKDNRLYQVIERVEIEGKTGIGPHTSGLLAETLAKEMPDIEYAVASVIREEVKTVSVGDTHIKAIIQFAGPDFFNVFSYGLIQGDKDLVLKDNNAIVISKELAIKLFKSTGNVLGNTIEFEHEKSYHVSGVFDGTQANSSVQFDFILPFEEYKKFNSNVLNWNYNSVNTYVALKEGSSVEEFNNKIADFMQNKRDNKESVKLITRPFSDVYLYGNYENGVQSGGRIEYVKLFSLIAILILIIACINFMNLSTAKASLRLKEIGVKKAMGASRKAFIYQHLTESLSMTFLSLILALILITIFLPSFNQIVGKHLTLNFNSRFIFSVLGIALATGVVASFYPALYLSGFNPVAVLKGNYTTSGKEVWTRKGLVISQFVFTIILIVGVVVVYNQIKYLQTKNLGYNKENIVCFEIEGNVEKNLETFLFELKNIPGIVDASSIGQNIVESGLNTFSINSWEGKESEGAVNFAFEMRPVNYGMIEMLGIEIKEGRPFSKDINSEDSKIIFNEAAIEAMTGLKDPIGKTIEIQGTKLEIIGVTNNFHFASLHEEIKPLFFVLRPSWTRLIMARIEAGTEKETIHRLQKFYQEYNSGFPFDYRFLDETYQKLYVAEQRVSILSKYFSGLTILISCLGLFGLAAFTAERRTKEIGIRKVMGSSATEIASLLSGDFTKMVIVSIVVALPVGYLVANRWLENFAYRIDLKWWYFAGAGIAALVIAWLTVSIQTIKAAMANPVECLKEE